MKIRAHKMKCLIAGCLFAASSSSWSMTTVFGNYDCGEWTKNKQSAKTWVLGYLSGLNVVIANPDKKIDPLGKVNSAEQIYLWIDNYCRANPLKYVSDGGLSLYLELTNK